ncbi:MAG: hypothetical protein JWP03_4465 [Phycisphaerales bacterium]|nr:hypothetical protein [Phycisphaerales bacterium]
MDDVLACRRPGTEPPPLPSPGVPEEGKNTSPEVSRVPIRVIAIACIVIGCTLAQWARADSIAVHFGGANGGAGGDSLVADGDTAGFIAQQHWNNTPVDVSSSDPTIAAAAAAAAGSGSLSSLLDSQGNPTGVSLSYSSGGVAFATGDPTNNADDRLMHSYLDAEAGNLIVTLANIPYATYDLYAYVGWNVQNLPQSGYAFTDVSLDTADFTTLGQPFSTTGYVLAPVPGNFTYPQGNVLHFSGLSGPTLDYFQNGAGLNGIQIVDTSLVAAPLPSPALMGIGLLVGLALIHFRAYSLSTEKSRFWAR